MFEFYSPGKLIDNDLELILVEQDPGDLDIGYVPVYKFKMVHVGQTNEIGRIEFRAGNTRDLVMSRRSFCLRSQRRTSRIPIRGARLPAFVPVSQHGFMVSEILIITPRLERWNW